MLNNQYLIGGKTNGRDYSQSIYEQRQEKLFQTKRKLNEFAENTMNMLVAEAIYYIFEQTLEGKSQAEKMYGKVLCEQYVRENSALILLNKFKTKSQLLAEMAFAINETYNSILAKVNKDDELTFTIKPSDQKFFYDQLLELDSDKVVKKITDRVCQASEEFIQSNINDKLDKEEITRDTKQRIDATKASTQEKLDAIRQEHANIGRYMVNNVGVNRTRNLYEHMINLTCGQILKNEELKSKFVTEGGKMDMDSITDKVDTMYRFVETINTANIQDVTIPYINSLLAGIK